MRFMLLMHPGLESEDDWTPDVEAVKAMTRYNEELTQAGALLAADGLHPSARGARVTYPGGQPTVTDGPFPETKEIVGGYWIIKADSKEEAVDWARRIPGGGDVMVEVRQIFEMEDMPAEVQEAGRLSRTPPEQTSA